MDRVALLHRVAMLEGVPEETLARIAECAAVDTHGAGTVIFREGDPGDCFYVVGEGRVEVLVRPAADVPEVSVATLGPGEGFGEMALLTGEPRSATVRAAEGVELLRVPREGFFDLVSDVAVYQHLAAVLCRRLRNTDANLQDAQMAQVAMSRYLSPADSGPPPTFAGTTPATRKITEAIATAAARDEPVLIAGEKGCGKRLVARHIIQAGARARGPVIAIDCGATERGAASGLFGHEAGHESGQNSRHIGALELCAEGTVIVLDPQALSAESERRLVEALARKTFRRIGGGEDIPLRARVIVIREVPSGESAPGADPALDRLFGGGCIWVPALRDRRRDIPAVVDGLVERHVAGTGAAKPAILNAAMERLISYDWPGNVAELETVVGRAVTVAGGGPVDAEHILIHMPAARGEGKLDLFAVPGVRGFAKSRAYPLVLQIPATAVLGFIVYMCFFGPRDDSNVALTLTWPIWWAALPISFLFAGRIWCTICPFSLVSSLVQRAACLEMKLPAWLKKSEVWPMAGLFVFLTWADEFWHYPDYPLLTGVVLGSVLLGTLVFSCLFARRVWCRYLCPLGGVNGVYSSAAIIELRANSEVCAHHCRSHECVAKGSATPCPMLEQPLILEHNRTCNLCMNCVKACPHDALHLYIRPPGTEIWEQRRPLLAAGVLAVLLTGVMLLHGVCFHLHSRGLHLMDVPPASWLGIATEEWAWTLDYALFLVVPLAAALGASSVSARRERTGLGRNLAQYGLAFAVLAVFMHIILEGGEFIANGLPDGIGLAAGVLGGPSDGWRYAFFTPVFVRLMQVLMAVVAVALTWRTLARIADERNAAVRRAAAVPHMVLAGVIGLAFTGLVTLAKVQPLPTPPDIEASITGEIDTAPASGAPELDGDPRAGAGAVTGGEEGGRPSDADTRQAEGTERPPAGVAGPAPSTRANAAPATGAGEPAHGGGAGSQLDRARGDVGAEPGPHF
jgi:transcriptional regulator with AAA-type ATPase domain/polyferredoxin